MMNEQSEFVESPSRIKALCERLDKCLFVRELCHEAALATRGPGNCPMCKGSGDLTRTTFATAIIVQPVEAAVGVPVSERIMELAADADYANEFALRHQLYDVGLKTLGRKLRVLADELTTAAAPPAQEKE